MSLTRFAQTIVNYSCSVQAGENVLIFAEGIEAKPLVVALIEEVYRRGAYAFYEIVDTDAQKAFIQGCSRPQMNTYAAQQLERLKRMQALIVISALDDPAKYADLPPERLSLFNEAFMQKCFFGYGVMNTKWIYVKYPTDAMARLFGQPKEQFEEFYYRVCTLDYAKLSAPMQKLARLFEQTDRVRIVAPGTDLAFSIKGIPAQVSDGRNGLPDGEVFTAPVRDSANGHIAFNCPLYFHGVLFEDIRLEFENGRIVRATANQTEQFNSMLDLDANARYLGEFAMGVNNLLTRPMKDILFDEKIGGSIHLAAGNSYATTDNGNHSIIHMDIVQLQTKEFGGGEVYFDGVLVRKDGKFVSGELAQLNASL